MTNSCKAILVFRVPDAIHKRTLFRRNLMMKKDKSGQSDQAQKESVQDSGIDLTASPDFVKIAEAYGIPHAMASSNEEESESRGAHKRR